MTTILPKPDVLAATAWRSNAELIEAVVKLGYIKKSDKVLDPTWGRGKWWTKWKPDDLTTHDKYTLDGIDFTDLPHGAGTFDVVAFDPPYVSVGGRETTGLPDFHDRYGLTAAPTSPASVQQLIDDGLAEMWRVLCDGGIGLVKNQDYISSGKFWDGTFWTTKRAYELGFKKLDRLEHLAKGRAQPPGRRQVHARRNLSTLFVFQKPKKRTRRT